MELNVSAATNAIEEYLRQVGEFNQEIIDICDELLRVQWEINNKAVRKQIIETAAVNSGWLSYE